MKATPGAVAAAPQPDILLIVLDDVGFSDFGCFGAEIRTPAIDRLAEGGLRFNRFDTRAICSPSRASLLAGRNSHAVGMADLPADSPAEAAASTPSYRGQLPDGIDMLPHALRRAGYHTTALGKWHLAPYYEDIHQEKRSSWPLNRGFDDFYGFLSGWTDQYHPDLVDGETALASPDHSGYHLTEDLVDRAIEHLDPRQDNPQFVYLALGAAHSPHRAPPEFSAGYRGDYDAGWDVIREHRFQKQKAMGLIPADTRLAARETGDPAWEDLSPLERRVFARFQENYAGFIEHTDHHLGRLLQHVERYGRETVVVLLSDNGPAAEAAMRGSFWTPYVETAEIEEMAAHLDELGSDGTMPQYQRPWAWVGATPFRRYKLWPFSGGTRTPLVVSWPSGVPDAGAVRAQFIELIDLAPTLAEIAGGDIHDATITGEHLPVAGRSIVHVLRNGDATARTTQYFELRGNRAITSGMWKAVAIHVPGTDFADDRWALFDLENDYAESIDVADEHPEVVRELVDLWFAETHGQVRPQLREMPPRIRGYDSFDLAY
jgi:arylsulfatase